VVAKHPTTFLASIDIGTNSVLLLIAQWDGQHLQPITEMFRVTRLGERFQQSGQIGEAAIRRTESVLKEYRKVIQAAGVKRIWCTATQIFRVAANGKVVAEHLGQIIGAPVTILSETAEAALTFLGALDSVKNNHATYWAIDIGGGSTEVGLGSYDQLQLTRSFPQGGVSLLETVMREEQLTTKEIEAIQNIMHQYWQQLPSKPYPIIGIGGTPTTLAALHQQLAVYNFEKIDGYRLQLHQIKEMFTHLNALPLKARRKLPGMAEGRADVILPATVVLQSFMEYVGTTELIVSARGLRYGILLWHLKENRWPVQL